MSDAGWAKPRNSTDDLAHWWRPAGRRACDQENIRIYTGPKQDPAVAQACMQCVVLVAEARELLGVSDE